MIFSKDFDLFSAIQKVRLSEKTSEILGQVSEKMKLESLAGIPECNGLSQFKEDTGGPSMPVREINLIACPLVQSS